MDITKLAVADTAFLHLKSAKGEFLYGDDGKPSGLVMYGPGSDAAAQVAARSAERVAQRFAENDNKVALPSLGERQAEEIGDLAAMTVSFQNFSYPPAGDKQGRELFEALYADKKLGFIKDQAAKFCGDWGKFSPTSQVG